ncbi:MAG: hypothetical protein AAF438_10310 [Pseudomonadota bacterium]
MEKIIITAFIVTSVVAALFLISGCTTVGKGRNSLARYQTDDQTLLDLFPQYVTSNKLSTEGLIPLTDKASTSYADYIKFRRERYGSAAIENAELSLTFRDRGAMPAFLPVDIKLPSKLYDLYTGAGDTDPSDRISLEQLIKARVNNVPDLLPRTTYHHSENGREVYYFYPRISLDFSSQLLAQNVGDRFSYLGVAVILDNQPKNPRGDKVRFVDFWPKDADIVEYTRGKLTQNAQLNAKATSSSGNETTAGTENTDGGNKATDGSKETGSSGAELAYTYSETFVNELQDAFERRTTGIFDDGKAFLAEFRSIKNKRIGGTYTFDLMLEMPAVLKVGDTTSTSEPLDEKISAHAYLVGVVRHVYKKGKTGLLTRVPEPDNDHVYEQVIVEPIASQKIWQYHGVPYTTNDTILSDTFALTVYTNNSDARYVVTSGTKPETVLGSGGGRESTITLPIDENPVEAQIRFMDIIVENDSGFRVLEAAQAPKFTIPGNKAGSFNAYAEYRLKE